MTPSHTELLYRGLSLDLEVGKEDKLLRALAGVRSDTGQSTSIQVKGARLAQALSNLDNLAEGAEFVLGHNLIGFDLPILQALNPNLQLLQLPAVDTLRLNPLAFRCLAPMALTVSHGDLCGPPSVPRSSLGRPACFLGPFPLLQRLVAPYAGRLTA